MVVWPGASSTAGVCRHGALTRITKLCEQGINVILIDHPRTVIGIWLVSVLINYFLKGSSVECLSLRLVYPGSSADSPPRPANNSLIASWLIEPVVIRLISQRV